MASDIILDPLEEFSDDSVEGLLFSERPVERTCGLCGEFLTTHQELRLGVCDVCRHDREDLVPEEFLEVDVYMQKRGEHESPLQESDSSEDDGFNEGLGDFEEENYLPRV